MKLTIKLTKAQLKSLNAALDREWDQLKELEANYGPRHVLKGVLHPWRVGVLGNSRRTPAEGVWG